MIHIKNLLFPNLCHRCLAPERNFLCESCLLGFELAPYEGGGIANLFDQGPDFLMKNRSDYQKIIKAFTLVQLSKLRWEFACIECEPELIYLKKYVKKNICLDGHKTLYLIHRQQDPILKEPIRKNSYILII